MKLAGSVAFVSGGGQGIGLGIARLLAEGGAKVGLADINADVARRAAAELVSQGHKALALPCDVTDYSGVGHAVKELESAFGPCQILVNNAGWSPNERFVETVPVTWHKTIAINFTGVLNCTRIIVEGMIARENGRIVCISSDAARVGTPREAVYAGAKAAVIAFAKSLAAEVAKYKITVNVVCPSSTDTPLLRSSLTEEQIQRRIQGNPMGRLGRPEDVAAAVRFFASADAGYITGQVISVNGGSSRVG